MTSKEKTHLNRLIQKGEGQKLDFKYHVAEAEKIAKSLVAFANSSGGTLLIGVKDNGKVKGIRSDEEIYMIETASEYYCRPRVEVSMEEKDYEGKTVLEVTVPQSKQKPHYAKENSKKWLAYVRYEDKNLLANKVFIDVMNRKRKGVTTRLKYTREEHDLLKFLEERGAITIKEYVRHTRIPYPRVHNMIVNLVSMGVVDLNIIPGRQYYTLREVPGEGNGSMG